MTHQNTHQRLTLCTEWCEQEIAKWRELYEDQLKKWQQAYQTDVGLWRSRANRASDLCMFVLILIPVAFWLGMFVGR